MMRLLHLSAWPCWSRGCGDCKYSDYHCICGFICDAMNVATVAVLWLLFTAPINVSQESIIKAGVGKIEETSKSTLDFKSKKI